MIGSVSSCTTENKTSSQNTPALASSPGCHFKKKKKDQSILKDTSGALSHLNVLSCSLWYMLVWPLVTVSMTKVILAALLPPHLVNHSTQHLLEFTRSICCTKDDKDKRTDSVTFSAAFLTNVFWHNINASWAISATILQPITKKVIGKKKDE